MRRSCLLSVSALAGGVVAISTAACAQEARTFNIPAGSLRDGLNQFATQSDQQLFYSGELVVGLQTPGLSGRYTPAGALDQLLRGSGIAWSETRPGVIFLRTAVAATEVEATVDEIVVTGTLLRASGELASPVEILNRDALDARGRGTVADVLAELPQNYAGSANAAASLSLTDRAGSNSALASGVNLRGLGPDATLVLVNGRRLAGTGFRGEFADVSALPSGAVERVDVLLDGASALYASHPRTGKLNVPELFSYPRWHAPPHPPLSFAWGCAYIRGGGRKPARRPGCHPPPNGAVGSPPPSARAAGDPCAICIP